MSLFKTIFLFLLYLICLPIYADAVHFQSETSSTLVAPLTQEEIKALDKKVFKVAIIEYPPFIYFTRDKNREPVDFDGVSYEALKIIGNKLGIRFEYEKCTDLNEAIGKVKEGKLDILIKMNESNDELPKSMPYFEKKSKIVILRGKTLTWTDIISQKEKKLTMVEVRGTSLFGLIKTNVIPNLIQVDTPIEALAKIAFNEADFALMDISQFGYYQRKLDSSRLIIVGDDQIFDIKTKFGFNPELGPHIISAFDKAISSFTAKEFEYLSRHWEEFKWEEPMVRPEFAILLFCIAFSTINNIIWYRFYVKSHALAERENNQRWLAAVNETIKNERAVIAAKNVQI